MNKPLSIPAPETRADWMGLLARAKPTRLAELMPTLPAHDFLRRPEIGTVMIRGRIGGRGAPFNLGEMTVTRCVVQLATGEVGHAQVQGRDKMHAVRAAIADAVMQSDAATRVRADVLAVLAVEELLRRQTRAEKAAATKVDFFTLVRGED